MHRRAFLKTGAAAGLSVSVAGCLDVGPLSSSPGATDDVVLEKPERYDDLRSARDDGALAYPIHADPLPEATVPAPLHDRTVSTREFVGERHVLMTFIFTRCPNACQLLTDALRHVQDDSVEQGFADEVAFMPVTFDPEHDTAEKLQEHGERHSVIREPGHWYYLRPDGPERAEEVVNGQFGIGFESLSPEEREERGMGEDMFFQHISAILLANKDGYVERLYTGGDASPVTLVDGVETLRERW
ncbi:SCO family protein [Halobacteriales archaeon QH_2_66_30]|nr:MAG: SCO family protein [Halobacteriales archaeon QH_2_66_30]PSQ48730.1 MAG: SCO family protein [Halobacteriales archaeon SW_7_65_23]